MIVNNITKAKNSPTASALELIPLQALPATEEKVLLAVLFSPK
tara:strand:+ start:56 stop:184 length:129 start_codon:yes stop_codon:yes gene_type:complete